MTLTVDTMCKSGRNAGKKNGKCDVKEIDHPCRQAWHNRNIMARLLHSVATLYINTRSMMK